VLSATDVGKEKLSLGRINITFEQDKLYKDAMITAAVSASTEVAESFCRTLLISEQSASQRSCSSVSICFGPISWRSCLGSTA